MSTPLEISVQGTPNPNAAKFTLNREVAAQGTTYRDAASAEAAAVRLAVNTVPSSSARREPVARSKISTDPAIAGSLRAVFPGVAVTNLTQPIVSVQAGISNRVASGSPSMGIVW